MSRAEVHRQRALRDVLGTFPTGVTVITTLGLPERRPVGLTVNSFSSVSLDPPLALWSLSRRSPNLAQFPVGKAHVIHILAEQQAPVALQFANPKADKPSAQSAHASPNRTVWTHAKANETSTSKHAASTPSSSARRALTFRPSRSSSIPAKPAPSPTRFNTPRPATWMANGRYQKS